MEHVADAVHEIARHHIGDLPPYDINEIIELCGIRVVEESSLGMFVGEGGLEETAGIADGDNGIVRLSLAFPRDVRRFTAGHELGHFVLHGEIGLHRDRPVDGAQRLRRRSRRERDADYLAGCFLMPRKPMRDEFQMRFLTDTYFPYDNMVVALCGSSDNARGRWKTKLDLARDLARAPYFNWTPIQPLHERFGVSVEAMAIRIRQLGLVEL